MNNIDENSKIKENKCIIGISNSNPYDTSIFVNNSDTYYTKISYEQLDKITTKLEDDTIKINDMNLIYIMECVSNNEIQLIFRFLCSPDCNSGKIFINAEVTKMIYKFVKLISKRNVIIDISDHSMASFFNNWDTVYLEMESPIIISNKTNNGLYEMIANKNDLINSSHPSLKQIGEMSNDNLIKISFTNMNDTKIYSINKNNSNVKLLSKGYSKHYKRENIFNFKQYEETQKNTKETIKDTEESQNEETIKDTEESQNEETIKYNELQEDEEKEIEYEPIHCEFSYNNAIIVISATHWCNIEFVNSNIDITKMRKCYESSFGKEATQELDEVINSAQSENDIKLAITSCVRQISSGTPAKIPRNEENTIKIKSLFDNITKPSLKKHKTIK